MLASALFQRQLVEPSLPASCLCQVPTKHPSAVPTILTVLTAFPRHWILAWGQPLDHKSSAPAKSVAVTTQTLPTV